MMRNLGGKPYLVTGDRDLLFYRKAGQLVAYRVTQGRCSCPATKQCKHLTDAREVRYDLLIEELEELTNAPLITIWSVLNANQHQG